MKKNNMKRLLMSVMLVSSMTLSSAAVVHATNAAPSIVERAMTNEQLVATTTPILQSYTKDASDKTWVMTKDSKFVIVANHIFVLHDGRIKEDYINTNRKRVNEVDW